MVKVLKYITTEERSTILRAAHDAGEVMFHDDFLEDGTKQLTIDTQPPDWRGYFKMIIPDDQLAWVHTYPDMDRAREVHMKNIRVARDKALVALDVPFMRAVEEGDTGEQARLKTEKQALRDIPSTFDLSSLTDPESLMDSWPEGLSRR
mgnify:CR=1 FL=1|jgi:hypothetical protein|tara:strand:- start:80 stop:526 length:447 start_codon:yes stop_codon:yes gene_type:complete